MGRGRRAVVLAAVVLPLVAVAPIALRMLAPPPAPVDVDTVIREAEFRPVHPPSRLWGPGALYLVDGDSFWKVCDADAALLDGKTEKSPTESRFRQALESDGIEVSGNVIERVGARLGATRATTVEYRVTDVAITSISLADLFGIEDVLLGRKECDKAVGILLDQKKQVCFGAAALSATISYTEHNGATFETGAKGRERSAGEIKTAGGEERAGEDLFYGIRLWRQCITPADATEPSVLADPATPRPAAPAVAVAF